MTIGAFALAALASCGGDDDMLNGAKSHGEKMGAKKCECAKAAPDQAGACTAELASMNADYEAFLETAKGEGSDMDALKKAYDEAYNKASTCE